MRRSILVLILLCTFAVPAVAKKHGLGMYLVGEDALELSDVERLHYVAGLMDAWLLESFLTKGERFGWLMECMSQRRGSDLREVEVMFHDYLVNHPKDMDQAGSALFFHAVQDFCHVGLKYRVMVRCKDSRRGMAVGQQEADSENISAGMEDRVKERYPGSRFMLVC